MSFKPFPAKGYRVDLDKVKKLTQSIDEATVSIDGNAVIEGNDTLEIFKCIICLGIPVQPIKECDKCETIFCDVCI